MGIMIGKGGKEKIAPVYNVKKLEKAQEEGFIVTPPTTIPKIQASKDKDKIVPREVEAYDDYTIQISSSRSKNGAMKLVDELSGKGYNAYISVADLPNKGTWYRVRIGHFNTKAEAKKFALSIKEKDKIKGIVLPSSK